MRKKKAFSVIIQNKRKQNRTRKRIREKFGSPESFSEKPFRFRTLRSIIYFAVFGLIILGTLYWLFK